MDRALTSTTLEDRLLFAAKVSPQVNFRHISIGKLQVQLLAVELPRQGKDSGVGAFSSCRATTKVTKAEVVHQGGYDPFSIPAIRLLSA